MRKLNLIITVSILVFCLDASGQINQDCSGNIGIGVTPSNKLHIRDNSNEFQLHLQNDYTAGDHSLSGAGIKFTNSYSHNFYLVNESKNYWGHTNSLDFRNHDGHIAIQLYSDHHVNINDHLNVDYNVKIHHSDEATKSGASGYDFNTATYGTGLIIEQGYSEGSGFYSDGDFAVIWSPGDQNRLLRVYDEDGMVEKWYIDGSGYAHTNSDKNKKENIRNIDIKFDKLDKLQGVKYNFKKELRNENITKNKTATRSDSIWPGDIEIGESNKFDPSTKDYYGFLAQDVELLFPELVNENEKGEKFISYIEFIPILVEAFKSQQKEIRLYESNMQELSERIEELEDIVSKCCDKSTKSSLKSAEINSTIDTEMNLNPANSLEQNIPNPFTESTQIKYFLTESISTANLYIYNMNGTQLKSIPLHQKGDGSVTINGGEFQAGMYMYTLIANGQVVDTKQMILTD